jgi:hypothetical protein
MKRLTCGSKIILFLTAYAPLGIIYLIIDYKEFRYPFFEHEYFSLSLLLVIIVMLWLLYKLITYFERKASDVETMKLIKVSNMNSEILSYIFSYLLPFLDFPEERRFLVTFFLLAIIGVLYTRSDMISINPILSIFGYNIIKVEWKKDGWKKSKEAMLISKLDYFEVKEKTILDAIQMHNELFLIKGAQND